MRILHVASFVGNIGDNASHKGLRNILNIFFSDYEIEKLEIRKFYKNYKLEDAKKFDKKFIAYANSFDLLIIGGGGFLDYWVKGSSTGTTIDLHPDLVKNITVPTFIMSVGCIPHLDVPEGNVQKFKKFLNAIAENPKITVAVRNDGSINALKDILSPKEQKNIPEILDNGFYYNFNSFCFFPVKDYIAINITVDQIKMNSSSRGVIDSDVYKDEMRKVVNYIARNMEKNIVFVPHIYTDIKAIYEVLDGIDDFIIRSRITIAPFVQGDEGADFLFGIYKNSSLVLATRFHANVCAMSMGVPVLGLIALDRVKYIYDSFNRCDEYVYLDSLYSTSLIDKIGEKLSFKKDQLLSKDIEMMKKEGLNKLELVFSKYFNLKSDN